ncbi:MAG: HAD family hydrolase [Betaproteobacteria bacterium]|nr:HAD family hydrolase [Betaproteobacteria bacterium]
MNSPLQQATDNANERMRRVRLMSFDVDGVMTDGTLYFLDSGEEMKAFNVLDGHGIKMLQEAGVRTAIFTARQSPAVERRAKNLGIEFLHQGVENKRVALEQLIASLGLEYADCGYIGDDVIDLPVLRRVGFAASVPNGAAIVQSHVHYVTKASGGRGAVREVCERILAAQGKLDAALARYLQ